jgi:hypothetical protein
MNNEPVAWAREDGVIAFFEKPKIDKQGFKWFPLYTHPVKTLTDEEIADLIANKVTDSEMIKQALRKAQEK